MKRKKVMDTQKKITLLVGLIFFFIVPFGAFGQQKVDLKMMTGPTGGSWIPLGGAIADAIQKEIPGVTISVSPGGGITNVEALESGKCDIGFSASSSAVDGIYGRPPFKKKMENMRQLANLYPQYFQMVVWDDSGLKSVTELKGKVISLAPKGHTGELLAQQVLEVYDLSYNDMTKVFHVPYGDSVPLMKDGQTNAFMLGTTVPAPTVMDLAKTKKIRLFALPDDKIKALQKINAGYLKGVIPKGTYPSVDYDVWTVSYFTHLIISAKLPDDLVYKITKTLANDLPRFVDVVKDMKGVTPKDLSLDIGIPFHPGALKYFREIGAL
jgi:TRAP transporter TAXI family solute receptor